MDTDPILDRDNSIPSPKLFLPFQLIEFGLIGLFSLLLIGGHFGLKGLIINGVLALFILMLLYSAVRIYFEYQEVLITGLGVFLKILLLGNAALVFCGVLFRFFNWDYSQEMTLVSLLSLSYPFVIYAIALSSLSGKVKAALVFNSLSLSLLAFGLAFSIESWQYGSSMLYGGYVLSLASVIVLSLLLRNNCSNKEKYHSVNYLARTMLLLAFSSLYLFDHFKLLYQ